MWWRLPEATKIPCGKISTNHCHPRPTAAPRPAPEVLHGHVAHLLRRPFPSDTRRRGVVLQLRGQGVGHDLPGAPGDEEGRWGKGLSIRSIPGKTWENPWKTHHKMWQIFQDFQVIARIIGHDRIVMDIAWCYVMECAGFPNLESVAVGSKWVTLPKYETTREIRVW